MKYIIIISLLFSVTVKAQTDKKRPSWSQGLPERQKTVSTSQPRLSIQDESQSTDVEAPIHDNIAAETPTFELEEFAPPQLKYEINQTATEQPTQTEENTNSPHSVSGSNYRSRLSAGQRFQKRSSNKTVKNPLHDEYKWQVLSTTPIGVPSHLNNVTNLNIEIFIKPDGSVSRVSSTDPNVTSQLLKYVTESVENWQFEAPEKIGIYDEMSKNFAIEIES